VYTRICLYCDSRDGHFWIARDLDRPRVVVAAGDSGHGFKFAPVLGPLIADVVEGRPDPLQPRFAWRPGHRVQRWQEATRAAS
jgi:sarcosine oxidase / L-pipecolate oxidase